MHSIFSHSIAAQDDCEETHCIYTYADVKLYDSNTTLFTYLEISENNHLGSIYSTVNSSHMSHTQTQCEFV